MQELSGELFSNQFAPLSPDNDHSDCQDAACDARTEEVDTDRADVSRLEEEALRDRLKIQELEEQVGGRADVSELIWTICRSKLCCQRKTTFYAP